MYWKWIIVIMLLALMNILLYEKIYQGEYKHFEMEKTEILQQTVQEQINSEISNHLKVFREMQKNSPLLQHANYTLLAGALPQEKKLLTVGISSVQRPQGSYLLDTLQSLFQVSSEAELKSIVVLVHLSDPDPEWLSQTVANISGLFALHIKAKNLFVVHGLLDDSSLRNINQSSPCEELYFRQKVDYALLMNFASNLSDYFLLMDDNIFCTPNFVSSISRALSAWKEYPWVVLEFSSLTFSGKVFHSSDLSHLASFFLLFLKDTPTHLLLTNFGFLLGQTAPISLTPKLFHSWDNGFISEDSCYKEKEEKKKLGKPNNPPARIYTDMFFRDFFLPEYAYSLDLKYFKTQHVFTGQTFTVVFKQSYKVIQIEVVTGIGIWGICRLEHGQVELGYLPIGKGHICNRYVLLGPLVKGQLNQEVYQDKDFVEEVRCVRLLVTAPQQSNLCIIGIHIWIHV
uniref:alpha-1,3-mannosyl-glycoprotein 4-beta-N-acetylglucosaminyltransferase-like protein MGAT4E n=1 Tax=Ictidomys tridecemlineatus TaxID=43179 RepID=UPI001A9DA43F|nr:alpha-1,3-mannosyl-glycoprotein 4-beta-N-acetylglucosaminyltransferase-like protein MGAT4E [Ictidomys tridecemlineatus]